jgi:hypothetical protein
MKNIFRWGAIGGQIAGSFSEWVVALALWYLKIKFIYKYNIRGTRFVIDFYIDAGPDWVPVEVRQFWGFETDARPRFRKEMIERLLNRPLQIVWDYQVSTFEEAITTMREIMKNPAASGAVFWLFPHKNTSRIIDKGVFSVYLNGPQQLVGPYHWDNARARKLSDQQDQSSLVSRMIRSA